MDADAVTAIATVATAVIAALAAWFAVREFLRAGRWKKAEFAAAHLQRMDTDEVLRFACHALDWGTGPLVVPSEYRALAKNKEMIEHEPRVLEQAMMPQLQEETRSGDGILYRLAFDRLFMFLGDAQRLLDLKLVDKEHLESLRYWLELIANWRYCSSGKNGDRVFVPFIDGFEYKSLLKLFGELGVAISLPKDCV